MASMSEFLERWAKLEPERCWGHLEKRINWVVDFSDATYFAMFNYSDGPKYQYQNIQAAVQEAITARGWGWIKPSMQSNGVTIIDPSRPIGSPKRLFHSQGDGPLALTLLGAYLQALEAN